MNTKKWLWGELLAVLKRQSVPYRDPAETQNTMRYSYSTFYFICLCFHHAGKVSVADIRAPALWMSPQMRVFFIFGRFHEDQRGDQKWLCPKIPSYVGSTAAWCPSALHYWSLHFLRKPSLAAAGCTADTQLTASAQQQRTEDSYFECREGWHGLRCGLLEKTSCHDTKH